MRCVYAAGLQHKLTCCMSQVAYYGDQAAGLTEAQLNLGIKQSYLSVGFKHE